MRHGATEQGRLLAQQGDSAVLPFCQLNIELNIEFNGTPNTFNIYFF
jgi:hypothetical protein